MQAGSDSRNSKWTWVAELARSHNVVALQEAGPT